MLSHYRLLEKIGEGGMGVIWKALDTRLGRHTALKVLPPELTADPERRRRLLREARTAAAVTHPNIATIYEVGEFDGITFISMELVEGRTLRAVIGGRPLPIAEALRLGAEIAEGLARAHHAAIVHRDLKPDNIIIGADGRPKILDFGLAKLVERQQEALRSQLSQQVTRTEDVTREGTILGTAAYMSPEQVRGEEVDVRSDIFSFGVVLYEMVTARVPFKGQTPIQTLAAILNEPAVAASRLNAQVPARLDEILGKCLDKVRRDRYQSCQDLVVDLRRADRDPQVASSPSYGSSRAASPAAATGRQSVRRWIGWATVVLLLVLSAVVWGIVPSRETPPAARSTRFVVLPPEKTRFGLQSYSFSISPDGTRLALLAVDSSGKRQLWIRNLDSLSAQALPGTDAVRAPFWSPDSRFIAFGSGGKLRKVDAAGGPVETLCEASNLTGGTWNREGVILFSPDADSPIYRVLAAGGVPAAVTSLDVSRQETAHRFPSFLPDGDHFLYVVQSGNDANNGIWVGSLSGKDQRRILPTLSSVRYAPPGFLLFVRERTLIAQRFDAHSLKLMGDAFPIAEGVQHWIWGLGNAGFSVSETGVLVFRSGAGYATQLTWFDRSGKSLESVGRPGAYLDPELSPDGKYVAVALEDERMARDIWLVDLLRGASTRFTFDEGEEKDPLWAPDGSWLAFSSRRIGRPDRHIRRGVSGAGDEALNLESAQSAGLMDVSSDGRYLLYGCTFDTGCGLWILPLEGDRKPHPFMQTPFFAQNARFSPDVRWIAYVSNESGRNEVYLDSFPTMTRKRQVSIDGGIQPRWRRDGRELYFLGGDGALMAVPIESSADLELGAPVALFKVSVGTPTAGQITIIDRQQYDVTADGQRFLLNLTSSEVFPITVVLNWAADLKP